MTSRRLRLHAVVNDVETHTFDLYPCCVTSFTCSHTGFTSHTNIMLTLLSAFSVLLLSQFTLPYTSAFHLLEMSSIK